MKLRDIIGGFFSVIYPLYLSKKLSKKRNKLYTSWLRREFASIGNGAYAVRPVYLLGGKYITIGNNFVCDHRLRLDAYDKFGNQTFTPRIIIGDNVNIQKDCHIGAINKITIGNNVLIASRVYISDHSHGAVTASALSVPPALRPLVSKGEVIIEDNVWLGEGVVVLPSVTIGANSIIGANSVVTKNIPANAVAAGNPAKVIRMLL